VNIDYEKLSSIEPYFPAVELAAKETTEAQKALQEATEQRKTINKIPKGKAGSGKGEQDILFSSRRTTQSCC
jgi:hypothetical protein